MEANEFRKLKLAALAYLATSDPRGLAGVVAREKLEELVCQQTDIAFTLLCKIAEKEFGYVGKEADIEDPNSLYNVVKLVREYVESRRVR